MTDAEITRKCAERMGWKHLGAIGVVDSECHYARDYEAKHPDKLFCLSGGNDWWLSPDGHNVCGPCQMDFDPLTNDAQCFALVKKLQLNFGHEIERDAWVAMHNPTDSGVRDADANRAICLCAAGLP